MRWLIFAVMAGALLSCAPRAGGLDEFEQWLAGEDGRAAHFAKFEAYLENEGVAGVVAAHQLWLVDRLQPACASAPYRAPPESVWAHIVPTLRYIRDHVEPAIGDVEVVSAYRDEAFNACVEGARLSAHRDFRALDLEPADPGVTRTRLIAALCPAHAGAGRRQNVGLGIYDGRRFHIDTLRFRGWGADRRGASFPCVS